MSKGTDSKDQKKEKINLGVEKEVIRRFKIEEGKEDGVENRMRIWSYLEIYSKKRNNKKINKIK